MTNDQLLQTGVGSTDWTGGVAPGGGTHTGVATITMQGGGQFVVAHNVAEVRRKLDAHAVPPGSLALVPWVSFDVPNSGSQRVVLNPTLVGGVVEGVGYGHNSYGLGHYGKST